MICDEILGNLQDGTLTADLQNEIDPLELTWQECSRRFLRKMTRSGRAVGVLLPAGARLRHDDIIHASGGLIIAIRVLPADVLIVRTTLANVATLAYLLGSLHCPIETAEDAIIIPADDAIAATLTRLGFCYSAANTRFQPIDPLPAVQWQSGLNVLPSGLM